MAALASGANRDADVLEPGIHDVRAVARAIQPASYDFFSRLRPERDVLAGEARLVTSAYHAVFRLAAVASAMIEVFSFRHVACVIVSGIVQLNGNIERRRGRKSLGPALSVVTSRRVDEFHHARENGGARVPSDGGSGAGCT